MTLRAVRKLTIICQKRRIFTAGYAQLPNKIKGLNTNPLDGVTIPGESAPLFNTRRFRLPYLSWVPLPMPVGPWSR